MKKFLQEFKEFISKGNVMDLAVGVIIGGAFSSIVTSLTDNIIKPLINCIGGAEVQGKIHLVGDNYIDYGAFISAIINFLIMALIIFVMVKIVNKAVALGKKLVIMGHSMGSFIVRCYTAWYPNAGFDGAIYMGTGGSNPIAGVGDFASSLIAKVTGYKKKVALLDKMTFGSYNDKFEKRTAFDWLTRDNAVVDKYINDEYCGFLFSAQGMNDLVKLNINANLDDWYARVPKNLPILVISGADDPVCDYSKGVVEIENKLKATAHTNVTAKLYNGARHEILNETNKNEVYADILLWISDNVL